MSQRLINIGSGPNTKSGDTVRHAFDLVNQNFTELYTILGQGNSFEIASNFKGSVFADDSTLIIDAINNKITTNDLTVNGSITINTENGLLRIRGQEAALLSLNPNDAPHIHIEAADPSIAELFLGDDQQFIRFATDGSVIINSRLGESAPVVVKGSDGILTNNGSLITDINTSNTNVVITVVNHGLVDGDKLYIEGIESGSIEINNQSYYAFNTTNDTFELLDITNNLVLSENVSPYDVDSVGVIFSATKGGDVVINAGGLDDSYGDEGVVEVYGKTISITTQGGNTWLFDGVNLTLPESGDILDNLGNTVLGSSYELPVASTATLGGVIVDGTTITIDNTGVISSSGGAPTNISHTGYNISGGNSVTKDGFSAFMDPFGKPGIQHLLNTGDAYTITATLIDNNNDNPTTSVHSYNVTLFNGDVSFPLSNGTMEYRGSTLIAIISLANANTIYRITWATTQSSSPGNVYSSIIIERLI